MTPTDKKNLYKAIARIEDLEKKVDSFLTPAFNKKPDPIKPEPRGKLKPKIETKPALDEGVESELDKLEKTESKITE